MPVRVGAALDVGVPVQAVATTAAATIAVKVRILFTRYRLVTVRCSYAAYVPDLALSPLLPLRRVIPIAVIVLLSR
jgi:hypothetical protein